MLWHTPIYEYCVIDRFIVHSSVLSIVRVAEDENFEFLASRQRIPIILFLRAERLTTATSTSFVWWDTKGFFLRSFAPSFD